MKFAEFFIWLPECPLWTCQVQSREPEAYLNFHPSLSSYWLLFLTHLSSGWIGDLKGLSWSRSLPPGLKHYTPSKLVLIWKQNVGNFWLLISVGPMDCPCSITESFKRITHGFYSLSIDVGSMGGKKNRREVSAVSQLLLKETVEPDILNHWQNIKKSQKQFHLQATCLKESAKTGCHPSHPGQSWTLWNNSLFLPVWQISAKEASSLLDSVVKKFHLSNRT